MRTRALYVVLSTLAMLGFGLFILACTGWLGWSPDGSQIVFGYYDTGADLYKIGLYQLGSGRARTLNPKELSITRGWLSAQWKRDGTALFVFKHCLEPEGLCAMEVDPSSGEIIRSVTIPSKDSTEGPFLPPIETKSSLMLVMDSGVHRINLDTFKAARIDTDSDTQFYSADAERIIYVKSKSNSELEVGLVDPQTLAKNYLFSIAADDPAFRGGKLRPFAAFEPEDSKIALSSERGKKSDIVLLNRAGLERVFTPKLPFRSFYIGSLRWSSTGTHLYAAVASTLADEDKKEDELEQLSVADIDVTNGEAKVTPVTMLKKNGDSDFRETFALYVPIWPSPDGGTVAISTANLEKDLISDKNRALYLVAMSNGTVTKIPAPVTRAKKKTKSK